MTATSGPEETALVDRKISILYEAGDHAPPLVLVSEIHKLQSRSSNLSTAANAILESTSIKLRKQYQTVAKKLFIEHLGLEQFGCVV